jgi:hypothetical protein
MSSAFFFLRINDHIQYLRRLEKTLRNEGDFRGSSHEACKLGVWLYGPGRGEVEGVGPEAVKLFDALFEPHKAFHDASARALALKESGDEQGCQAAITEMIRLSTTLINELTALDKLEQPSVH